MWEAFAFTLVFFIEKTREAFVMQMQKLLTFFQQNTNVFEILKFEILTKR